MSTITKYEYMLKLAPSVTLVNDIIQRPEEYKNNPLVFYKEAETIANGTDFGFYRAIFATNIQETEMDLKNVFDLSSSLYYYFKSGEKQILIIINDQDVNTNLNIISSSDINLSNNQFMIGVGF